MLLKLEVLRPRDPNFRTFGLESSLKLIILDLIQLTFRIIMANSKQFIGKPYIKMHFYSYNTKSLPKAPHSLRITGLDVQEHVWFSINESTELKIEI